eukprot:GFKZ01012089.1.p1 GENE.GFKZ01012089.1~~GFKZ01012089.1.p1  ORF type:complete len:774 (-),score=116.62 GFKZ01012089.1:952-3273(-)
MQPFSSFVAPLSMAKLIRSQSSRIPLQLSPSRKPPLSTPRLTRCSVADAIPSLGNLIEIDVSRGALRKAVGRLEQAVKYQTNRDTFVLAYHHFHLVIHQAALTRQWEVAFRAFHALESMGHLCVRSTSGHLFDALTRAGRMNECQQVLSRLWSHRMRLYDRRTMTLTESQMQRRRPDEKMVTQIANAAINSGRPDLAVDMVREMERNGVLISIFTVSVLIKAHGRQGNHEDITKMVASLNRRDLTPDLILFNTAIDAYIRCGQRGLAFSILKEIIRKGLKPNARSFNPILKGLARSGKIEEMNAVMNEMVKRGVQASGYTFNAVISAYVKQGDWDKAMAALHNLERLDDREAERNLAVGYTTLISGYAAQGKVNDAMQLLKAMVNRRGSNFEEAGVACTAILSAMMQKGEVVSAWRLFRSVRQRLAIRLPVDMYCAVIRGLAKRANAAALRTAENVFEEMMSEFEQDGGSKRSTAREKNAKSVGGEATPADIAFAYNAMIDGYVRCRDTISAEKMLDQMEDRGHVPTTITYTTIVNGYGKELDIVSAKRVFRRMRNAGIRPDRVAMNAFLGAHVRVGDMETAINLFEEMQRYAGPISPNLVTFSAIIAGYVRQNMVTEAWDMYEEMKGVGIVPNERLLERMMAVFVSTDLKPGRGEIWELNDLDDNLLPIDEPFKIEADGIAVDMNGSDAGERAGWDEECASQRENYARGTRAEKCGSRRDGEVHNEVEQLRGTDSGWASERALVLMKDMDNCKCSEVNKERWRHAIQSLWGA